jgi:hypothetical protein
MLRFHARTFDLLGMEPGVSPSAVELLNQVENKIGRPLPASVREWYELQDEMVSMLRALQGLPLRLC